jgi:ankyrin repeat protein
VTFIAEDTVSLTSQLPDGLIDRLHKRETLLHLAAKTNRVKSVSMLLSRGADRELLDSNGLTPAEVT